MLTSSQSAARKKMDPFRCYIGERVLLRHSLLEVVRYEIRGRTLLFVCRCPETRRETPITLHELLEHIVERPKAA